MPHPLYPKSRDTVPIAQEAWWVLGPVWIGPENFTPHQSTIQPVASHCTNYTIPATVISKELKYSADYIRIKATVQFLEVPDYKTPEFYGDKKKVKKCAYVQYSYV
jgi:hypothetical protein